MPSLGFIHGNFKYEAITSKWNAIKEKTKTFSYFGSSREEEPNATSISTPQDNIKISTPEQNPTELAYKGAYLTVQDPQKVGPIKNGLDKMSQAGISLDGLKIVSTPEQDANFDAPYGRHVLEDNTILLRHSVNWTELAQATHNQFPQWGRNTYGGESHLFLHEGGHYAHHKVASEDVIDEAHEPFDDEDSGKIEAEIGHPYPASKPSEMVAEMFAAKIGAGKVFSPYAEFLYKLHSGPKVPCLEESVQVQISKIDQDFSDKYLALKKSKPKKQKFSEFPTLPEPPKIPKDPDWEFLKQVPFDEFSRILDLHKEEMKAYDNQWNAYKEYSGPMNLDRKRAPFKKKPPYETSPIYDRLQGPGRPRSASRGKDR